MKHFLSTLILFFPLFSMSKLYAQEKSENDTIANAMVFPPGSKMTLKLVKNNQNTYDYKVIKYSEFTQQYKIFET